MTKKIILLIVAYCLLSFTHKFYVSINQISYNQPKKRLEITSRFFVDDINRALETIHKRPFYVGDKLETLEDINLLKLYFEKHMIVLIDNKKVTVTHHNYEMEDDVLICYFVVKNVSKIKNLTFKNTILMDLEEEQQNIHHLSINNKKHTKLLTKNSSEFQIKI